VEVVVHMEQLVVVVVGLHKEQLVVEEVGHMA